MLLNKTRKATVPTLNMIQKHVVSAVRACIWELWLFSLSLFAAVQMFLSESTCSSARCCSSQEGRQAGERWRVNSVQFRALQVFSLMYLSLQRWISWRTQNRCRHSVWLQSRMMTSDGLSFFLLLLSFSVSPWINVQNRQRHRENQLDTFAGRNHLISLIVLPHLFSHWGLDPETLWEVWQ